MSDSSSAQAGLSRTRTTKSGAKRAFAWCVRSDIGAYPPTVGLADDLELSRRHARIQGTPDGGIEIELSFVDEPMPGALITRGPFLFIRHPFYVSYTLAWLPERMTPLSVPSAA